MSDIISGKAGDVSTYIGREGEGEPVPVGVLKCFFHGSGLKAWGHHGGELPVLFFVLPEP